MFKTIASLKYSDKALISQVKSLAHREKLPETTKALGKFIDGWEKALQWTDFEYLVKNILIGDIEMMEKLGIYECSSEDFALCSLICQSKIEVSQIIEDGLDLMYEEG